MASLARGSLAGSSSRRGIPADGLEARKRSDKSRFDRKKTIGRQIEAKGEELRQDWHAKREELRYSHREKRYDGESRLRENGSGCDDKAEVGRISYSGPRTCLSTAQPVCDMQPLWTIDAGHYGDLCVCKEEQCFLLFDFLIFCTGICFISCFDDPPACNIGATSWARTVKVSLIFPLAPAHLCQFNLLPRNSRALAKRHMTLSFMFAALFSCLTRAKLDVHFLDKRLKRCENQSTSRRILHILVVIGMFWCEAKALS